MRTIAVIGTGLIGTSIALALRARGVTVYLSDADPANARTAAILGAGQLGDPVEPADVALIAVPPAHVARTLAQAQAQDLARTYTDVASVKAQPQSEAAALGLDLSRFVGGHPLAGRERSGPLAARGDLFEGRPWVLTPGESTSKESLDHALELIALCGAVPVVMGAEAHDRAVALVSHAPQLVASLMAARLEHADDSTVRLCGQGIRDVTRIAASDPHLWTDILGANALVVAEVLAEFAEDLRGTVAALHELAAAGGQKQRHGSAEIVDVLRRGNVGQARIPGKHGAPSTRYEPVPVVIGDQPGELGRLFADAGEVGINVEDVTIEHSPGQPVGLVELMVVPAVAEELANELRRRGWTVQW